MQSGEISTSLGRCWAARCGFACRAAECHVRALPRVLPELTPPVCQADQDKYVRNVSTQDGYFNIKEAESAKGMEVEFVDMSCRQSFVGKQI